jgi:hypothetical protein
MYKCEAVVCQLRNVLCDPVVGGSSTLGFCGL